jgi:hypothetical protein
MRGLVIGVVLVVCAAIGGGVWFGMRDANPVKDRAIVQNDPKPTLEEEAIQLANAGALLFANNELDQAETRAKAAIEKDPLCKPAIELLARINEKKTSVAAAAENAKKAEDARNAEAAAQAAEQKRMADFAAAEEKRLQAQRMADEQRTKQEAEDKRIADQKQQEEAMLVLQTNVAAADRALKSEDWKTAEDALNSVPSSFANDARVTALRTEVDALKNAPQPKPETRAATPKPVVAKSPKKATPRPQRVSKAEETPARPVIKPPTVVRSTPPPIIVPAKKPAGKTNAFHL